MIVSNLQNVYIDAWYGKTKQIGKIYSVTNKIDVISIYHIIKIDQMIKIAGQFWWYFISFAWVKYLIRILPS